MYVPGRTHAQRESDRWNSRLVSVISQADISESIIESSLKPLTLREHFKGLIERTGKKCLFYRSDRPTSPSSRAGEK